MLQSEVLALPPEVLGVPTYELCIAVNILVLVATTIYLLRALGRREYSEAVTADAIAWLLMAYVEKGHKKPLLKLPKRFEIRSHYKPSEEAIKLVEQVEKSIGGNL